MSEFPVLIAAITHSYFSYIILFGILTLLERVSVKQHQPFSSRFSGVLIWIAYIPVSMIIYHGLYSLWRYLGIKPILTFSLIGSLGWAGPAAAFLAAISGATIADFIMYWYHRAQHRFLWRFHAVHHSIRDLNAVNSYHHITESFFSSILVALPTTLLVVDYGPTIPLLVFLTSLQAIYLHSPTRLNAGSLRVIFGDNIWHRIHHSVEEQHFNKNFGVMTTVWDRLFGTAYFPRPDDWPDVGIADTLPPRGIGDWLTLPLRYGKNA